MIHGHWRRRQRTSAARFETVPIEGVASGRHQAGSLLVITLWIVTILATLAIAIGRYLSVEARLIKYRLARERAMALARSGVHLAVERLRQDRQKDAYDWLGDDWARPEEDQDTWVVSLPGGEQAGEGARGRVEIRITDEERKLNLNEASSASLTNLLVQAQVPGAAGLSSAVVDYRDPPQDGEDWPESQLPYFAKNQPFAAIEELNDLPGMTPQAYDALASSTTCSTHPAAKLNINTVTPEVLLALGVSAEGQSKLIEYRNRDHVFKDPQALYNQLRDEVGLVADGEDINTLKNLQVASQTFVIVSEGVVQAPSVRYRVRAIMERSSGPEPTMLGWREG